jgi:hypothetical protein
MARLKVVPMALGMGITWGLGMMCLGWVSAAGWGVKIVEALSSLYLGFSGTFVGGVIGGLWGFADAFLAGLVLALLYNGFVGWKHEEDVSILSHTEQPAH